MEIKRGKYYQTKFNIPICCCVERKKPKAGREGNKSVDYDQATEADTNRCMSVTVKELLVRSIRIIVSLSCLRLNTQRQKWLVKVRMAMTAQVPYQQSIRGPIQRYQPNEPLE